MKHNYTQKQVQELDGIIPILPKGGTTANRQLTPSYWATCPTLETRV